MGMQGVEVRERGNLRSSMLPTLTRPALVDLDPVRARGGLMYQGTNVIKSQGNVFGFS